FQTFPHKNLEIPQNFPDFENVPTRTRNGQKDGAGKDTDGHGELARYGVPHQRHRKFEEVCASEFCNKKHYINCDT
ncbi:MAG: hypothetical protein AAGJ35_12285, partial [Myxococcota bacterium]